MLRFQQAKLDSPSCSHFSLQVLYYVAVCYVKRISLLVVVLQSHVSDILFGTLVVCSDLWVVFSVTIMFAVTFSRAVLIDNMCVRAMDECVCA